MNFRFTNEYPLSRLDEIVYYILGPRLWIPRADYPDFLDWAEKAYKELKSENKRALLALFGKDIVGVMIYQRHKKFQDVLELKNLSVRPDYRGRYVASFLLRNAEIEGRKEFHSEHVIADAKARNLAVRLFMVKHGYRVTGKEDLYGLNSGTDAIYSKKLYPYARRT